jgi:hypothetical protein
MPAHRIDLCAAGFGSHFPKQQVRETVGFMFGEHNNLLLIELLGDNDNRIADIFAARAMN